MACVLGAVLKLNSVFAYQLGFAVWRWYPAPWRCRSRMVQSAQVALYRRTKLMRRRSLHRWPWKVIKIQYSLLFYHAVPCGNLLYNSRLLPSFCKICFKFRSSVNLTGFTAILTFEWQRATEWHFVQTESLGSQSQAYCQSNIFCIFIYSCYLVLLQWKSICR